MYNDDNSRLIDIGGQRSEHKKWIHFFDSVKCVFFILALNSYDKQIRGDQFLNEASIVIFLNKMDLFEMKTRNIRFNEFIPEYRNENTVERIVEYIKTEMTKDASNNRQVYVHSTTATETDSVKKTFSQGIERVINKQIENEAQNRY
ncbi:hypothetical protein WR25_09500 [Diploscapter pachys]|uniref:G-protein alpha subunit n=1 Tax=Diploscapter pachys TaxID=2018661 RepID=A0A2A2J3J2_9BILA|nr:hypothetical protein WR25_09500 [Diploscapter pachys]